MGFWVNTEDAYYTLDNDFIESVWHLLKEIWDKDLIYRGYKVVPYDPRIGATLSSHELAQGYKEVEDPSIFVRFKLAEEENLPISIEVDYIFRETFNNISFFFKILKQFPKIKFWLPHFGCGIFLHWDRVLDICENTPLLLSSADHSFYWSNIFNTKDFKKIPLAYASDHPFNGFASLKIYKNWKKFKNIK